MRVSSRALRSVLLASTGVLSLATSTRLAAQGPQSNSRSASRPATIDALLAEEGYVLPPEPIVRLVDAPRERNFTLVAPNPGARRYSVHLIGDGQPTLAALGRPHYNLGGFQVDYVAERSRALNTRSSVGLESIDLQGAHNVAIQLPAGARVGAATWSPDGTVLSYMAEFPNSTQVYLADPATGKSRPLSRTPLLATNVTNWEWTADGKSIVAVVVPDGRGPEPKEPAIATEPVVRLNLDNKLKTRTAPDLLESPYEKALLEFHTTGQLAVIDVKSGALRKVGTPGMIRSLDASPDGQFFRVTYLDKPFSYVLPVSSFGTTEVVIDGTGKVLTQLSHRALRVSDPPDTAQAGRGAGANVAGGGRGGVGAADTGKRNIEWSPAGPGLIYLQLAPLAAGQRGDSSTNARRHDRVMQWVPPFDSTSAKTLFDTENRITAVRFSDDGKIMFVSEAGGPSREIAVFLSDTSKHYEIVKASGRGGTGGRGRGAAGGAPAGAGRGGAGAGGPQLVTQPGSRGASVVMLSTDGQHVFVQGTDSTRGDSLRPQHVYVERVAITSGTHERIYESTGDYTESISAPLDNDFNRALIQRESKTMVPQSYLLDVRSGQAKQLTDNKDLMPEMTNAVRKTVWAHRADGHTFRIQVTLPAGYKDGTRLPALFWFYPAEFENQQAYNNGLNTGANRGGGSRWATYGPRTLAFLTVEGYAVVEPDTPIFGQNGQPPNDHYVDDLRDDLAATIDALDTLGIIDRQRLAIGGHSYGAFSTVNAMVHTPFFKAGIAGDGDYNRTLTPNGFQNERRDLWQGRDTYLAMSPFLYADRLNGALLMYHSLEDQNEGTDPINSIRMYHALQGLGKTTALYMYPYEDHGPVARETVLDQWARWVAWLDKYVKNPGHSQVP